MFNLIAQEPDFLVISKFEDVPFHKDEEDVGLLQKIKSDLQIETLYPVHRLDKMTSGVIVLARNKETARELAGLFSERKVEKCYVAIAGNKPQKKQGVIAGDMEPSRGGTWILKRSFTNPAITLFLSKSMRPGLRTYILKPLTGKTHQLRVALKAIGAPIIGDPLYSPSKEQISDRGYLHAYFLEFQLKGRLYSFLDLPSRGKLFQSQEFKESFTEYMQIHTINWPPCKFG